MPAYTRSSFPVRLVLVFLSVSVFIFTFLFMPASLIRIAAAQNASPAQSNLGEKTGLTMGTNVENVENVKNDKNFKNDKNVKNNPPAAAGKPISNLAIGAQTTVEFPLQSPTQSVDASGLASLEINPGNRMRRMTGIKHLAGDQLQFWTRPKAFSASDAITLVPFAAFTGLLIASDGWISRQVPDRPQQLQQSLNISNYGVYALASGAGASLLWGQMTHDDHLQESSLLSTEAAINSALAAYTLGVITQRSRPSAAGGNGFFHGGGSFPSEHSAVAWSLATVIAHEYPGPLTRFLAYGLASTVTLTRVTSQQHFASDAFVGSALGWYLGRQVYRSHHDLELGGGSWGGGSWGPGWSDAVGSEFHWQSLKTGKEHDRPHHSSSNMASAYEPLDSWIYPAFERLAAMGYVGNAYLDQRPWTRIECARLLEDAAERLPQDDSAKDPVLQLYQALAQEFAVETRRLKGRDPMTAAIDSVYTRVTSISGPALEDGFHFGQTQVNDYGRPYASGVSSIAGVGSELTAGALAFYVRAEFQQAPAEAAYSTTVLQAIALADNRPVLATSTAAIVQPVILESMVALDIHDFQMSFGKQDAWLSPSRSGSLLLSNNAAPFLMLRIDRTTAYQIPLLSRLLGPARSEFFLGQLSGQQFVYNGTITLGPRLNPQPFLHGDRISFKPSTNLEFGMGVVVMFGGPGLPFTWTNFLRTYYLHSSDTAVNPGKRFSAFDFTYRVPRLRKWLTIYSDSLVVDEFSPIGSSRPSLNPGMYFPQMPRVQRLEFRIEGLKTSQAPHTDFPPGYVYTDRRYLSGYTNNGELLGNWIGRAGIGGQSWATYHFSARNTIEGSFRHMEVDHSFLEGGHLNDFSVESQLRLRAGIVLTSRIQYERRAFPLLASQPQNNLTTSFQIALAPKRNAERHWQSAASDGGTGSQEPEEARAAGQSRKP
jgi:hypothetical protein